MAAGYDDTTIRHNAWINKLENVVQDYTIFANKNLFPVSGPGVTPGGNVISWGIRYDATNNGGLMSTYADAAPSSDEYADVKAYQTKDYYQHLAQTYDILKNQMETNVNGQEITHSTDEAAFTNSAKLMAADIATTIASDLKTMIDSSGNFSDAAISRSTYNLASSEQATVGTLALSDIDSSIQDLETKEYGRANPETDLFIMASNVNKRRIANLSTKVQYGEFNSSSDSTQSIDGGRNHRVKAYDGIPIYVENSLGNADILIIRRGAVSIFDHWAPATKDLNVDAWQKKMLMGQGSNIIVTNPRFCAKLSGITG